MKRAMLYERESDRGGWDGCMVLLATRLFWVARYGSHGRGCVGDAWARWLGGGGPVDRRRSYDCG